jgi:hypothetical protein
VSDEQSAEREEVGAAAVQLQPPEGTYNFAPSAFTNVDASAVVRRGNPALRRAQLHRAPRTRLGHARCRRPRLTPVTATP